MEEKKGAYYLACERNWVFEMLMFCAGGMGAYTFVLRGGVFCNAQTANIVMMGIAFGQRRLSDGLYFFIPITAYCAGTAISELLPGSVRRLRLFRWDTWLIGFEAAVLFLVGFLPLSLPDQIVQITINFLASMQYNTFRQAEGVPMATTFCTNHVRQFGIGITKYFAKGDRQALARGLKHLKMLAAFSLGAAVVAALCGAAGAHAIWFVCAVMLAAFVVLAYTDVVYEHDMLQKKPRGH